MRVVIHGGMHKTGTTSLQLLLHLNRGRLAEHGICYPDAGRQHHNTFLAAKQPDWRPDRCAELIALAGNAEVLLLSGEVVSTLSADQFRRLRSGFAGYPVTFVICFRHWSGFLPSRWAQNCKRRDSQSFDRYVEEVTRDAGHTDFWYDAVLDRAAAAEESEVVAVSFDNAERSGMEPLGAILRAVGLRSDMVDELVPTAARRNKRLPWVFGELARLLNGAAAARLGIPQDELCHAIGAFRNVDALFDFGRRLTTLSPPLLARLRRSVRSRMTERIVRDLPNSGEARRRLEAAHAGRFANPIDGKIFPDGIETRLTVSDFEWPEFQDKNRNQVERALDRLLEDRRPKPAVAAQPTA